MGPMSRCRSARLPAHWSHAPVRIALVVALAAIATLVAVDVAGAQARRMDAGRSASPDLCGGRATSKLRLRARDGAIEVEFELEHSGRRCLAACDRPRAARRLEGHPTGIRVAAAFELDRRLPDLAGTDAVTVTAWGPSGATCRATAVLRAS